MTVPPWVREVAKAIAAFLAALAAGLATSTSAGLDVGPTLVAVVGALGTGLLTFAVPNATPTGRRRDGVEMTEEWPPSAALIPPDAGNPA